jgi:hydrogenase-1 operon protein HyaF
MYHSIPVLPEPEELQALPGARQALQTLLQCLRDCTNGLATQRRPRPKSATASCSTNCWGGRGAAIVAAQPSLRIQESIFAGVWRLYGQG